MTDQELAICVPCQSTGGSLPAVKFCTTCGESLCKSCVEFHSKLKITQAHVLVDCSSNNTDIIQAAQVLSTYMVCQNHGDKTVEFLCEEHDKVCCPTCATLNHRMCQHVVEIKKLANRPKIKRNIDRFRAHLEEAGSCMEEIINVNNVCRMDFEKSKKNIPNQLEQMKLTVVKLFERIESDVMDKINSMYVDEDIVTCNREERWIMKLNANADLVKMLDTIIEIGTDHQVFVALHKMKSTLLDTKMACADQGPHIVGKRLTLKIKDILEHVLQTEIIDDLVAVETVMNQFDLPKTHAYNSSVDVEEATTSSDTLEEECDEACSTRKTNEDTLVEREEQERQEKEQKEEEVREYQAKPAKLMEIAARQREKEREIEEKQAHQQEEARRERPRDDRRDDRDRMPLHKDRGGGGWRDRGPPRDDRGPPPRNDRGPPPRDDRGPPRDDRGPPARDHWRDREAARDRRFDNRDKRLDKEEMGRLQGERGRDRGVPPRDDRGGGGDWRSRGGDRDDGPGWRRGDGPPPRDGGRGDRGDRGDRDMRRGPGPSDLDDE